MSQTPLEKRALRRARNQSLVDMNLVSLIDIFTILIFFLLSNSAEVQSLATSKSVRLPESVASKSPKDTVVIAVNNQEIVVQGRHVVTVAEAMASPGDAIEALQAELALQARHERVRQTESGGATQPITILGDREIPYQLLRKVMVSCARANFTDVSFAVQRKSGA
jgi:biopolymer transport protein ExbD